MSIVRTGFHYEMNDGKPKFSHTSIIYSCREDLYIAHVPRRVYKYQLDDLKLESLDSKFINPRHVYPVFEERIFTKAVHVSNHGVFEKEPCLLSYGCEPNIDDTKLWRTIYEEARVCEILRTRQHPNVAHYLGCRVEKGYIVSLCFEKYVETLRARVEREGHNFDKKGCMNAVASAIEHLHSLGLCHNDISPYNIMFKTDGTPVLIDFDSCRPSGCSLGQKRGTPNFSHADVSLSTEENDRIGLRKLKEYIEEKCKATRTRSET